VHNKTDAFLILAYSFFKGHIHLLKVNLHLPISPIGRLDFLLTALSNAFWIVC